VQHLITSITPSATAAAAAAAPGSSGGGVASLDAIVGGTVTTPAAATGVGKVGGSGDDATEEDLFALPMSPRSPEMKRSPFSIL
jgi:hypothetical protein